MQTQFPVEYGLYRCSVCGLGDKRCWVMVTCYVSSFLAVTSSIDDGVGPIGGNTQYQYCSFILIKGIVKLLTYGNGKRKEKKRKEKKTKKHYLYFNQDVHSELKLVP